MHQICHFELPADDVGRAKKFYEELFGWKFEHFPEWDYYGITTGEKESNLPGGMMKRQAKEQTPVNYIDVDCIETFSQKVKELGGQVVMEKTPVGEMGWFAICIDTENNAFGLWECNKNAPKE